MVSCRVRPARSGPCRIGVQHCWHRRRLTNRDRGRPRAGPAARGAWDFGELSHFRAGKRPVLLDFDRPKAMIAVRCARRLHRLCCIQRRHLWPKRSDNPENPFRRGSILTRIVVRAEEAGRTRGRAGTDLQSFIA